MEGGTSALEAIPEEEHTHEEKEEDGEKAGQGEVKGGEREEEESASLPAQETPVPEESPVLETGGDEREGEEEEGEKGGAVEPLPPHQGEGGEGGLQLSEIPEVITSSEEPQAPPLEVSGTTTASYTCDSLGVSFRVQRSRLSCKKRERWY